MTSQSAQERGPNGRRLTRGLYAAALLLAIGSVPIGCGIPYVYRGISPLHPTGLVVRLADPAVSAAAARGRYQARGARPGADPRPGPRRIRPPQLPRPAPARPKSGTASPDSSTDRRRFTSRSATTSESWSRRSATRSTRPRFTRSPAPPSSCIAITNARSTSTSNTGRTTRSRSTPTITGVEVVYIDKDYLRRIGGPAQATTP